MRCAPSLPRIADGAALRDVLTGFSGEEFEFYASIPALGDDVRVTVATKDGNGAAPTTFDWLLRNYPDLKPEVMKRMVAAYTTMRHTMNEGVGKEELAKVDSTLRAFGFPSIRDMFPAIETPADMEKHWQEPWVEIAPMPDGRDTEPKIVIQTFPSWTPEDTFGIVLHKGEIVYAGDDPDYQWS